MTRIAYSVLLACTLTIAAKAQEPDGDRPSNIILLIGDDHGFPYFGFTGSEHVHTPHMDRLAQNGAVFLLGHVTDNHCRPSLQTLVTGLYPLQYQALVDRYHTEATRDSEEYKRASPPERRDFDVLFRAQVMRRFETLPALLAKRGYVSFQGGKWWESSFENGGFTEGMSNAWSLDQRGKPGWFRSMMGGEGMTLGGETMHPAKDFIARHRDEPFFVWYGPSLPHTPLNPPARHLRPYIDTGLSESATEYYGNCTWFDEGVGELVRYVKELGLAERTLFVYVNDNGWEQPPFAEYKGAPILYANGGPRGKLSLHDQAFRTPVVLSMPGKIRPQVFAEDLVSSVDLVPTMLDYAGVSVPEELPGYSLRPIVERRSSSPREALIGRVTQLRSDTDVMGRRAEGYYLRTRRWHFLWTTGDDHTELYDMDADPGAEHNVIASHPDLAAEFQRDIEKWRQAMLLRVGASAAQ